jgi:phage gp29-like protein
MTTADSQAAVNQQKINRLIEQVIKALDSGDIAAAQKYLNELAQELPTVDAKTHVAIAINGLIYLNDTQKAQGCM